MPRILIALALGLSVLLAAHVRADTRSQSRIRLALSALEHIGSDLFFIGFQSIRAPGEGGQTYMILDFRFEGLPPDDNTLYARIDRICKTVLSNRRLVKDLSSAGYDMVSVAFDERSQYDCL